MQLIGGQVEAGQVAHHAPIGGDSPADGIALDVEPLQPAAEAMHLYNRALLGRVKAV